MAEFKKRSRKGVGRARRRDRARITQESGENTVIVKRGVSKDNSAALNKLSKLTFDNDAADGEEGETPIFKVKRSKKSQKLTKKKKPTLRSLVNPDAPDPESKPALTQGYMGGENIDYSKDAMAKMKEEFTIRLKSTHSAKPEDDGEELLMAGGELNGASVVVPAEGDPMQLEEAEENEELPKEQIIPSSSRIRELKERRQRRAQYGFSSNDYISLDKKMSDEKDSRLVAGGPADDDDPMSVDSDEDKYDPYGQSGKRIAFGDPGRNMKEETKKTLWEIEQEMNEPDYDNQDEDARWEEEQMRKTGASFTKRNAPQGIKGAVDSYDRTRPRRRRSDDGEITHEKAFRATLEFEPVSSEIIKRNLETTLGRVNEMFNHHSIESSKAIMAVEDSEQKMERDKKEFQELKGNLEYFRELRDFGLDLLDCLNAKNKSLKSMEETLEEKAINAATALRQFRRQEVEEELDDTRAILELKHFTSTPDVEERRRERMGKRRREREIRTQKENNRSERDWKWRAVGGIPPVGWESDQEDESFIREYHDYQDTIADKAASLFSDVYSEYDSLPPVLKRFEDWKWQFPLEYEQAYGSLSIPKIAEVYARQEILARWDAMTFSSIKFRSMEWYDALYDYGTERPPDAAPVPNSIKNEKDRDLDVIPTLVASILYPRLKMILTHLYDPYSSRHTMKIRKLFEELEGFDGFDKIELLQKECLAVLRISLENAATEHIALALSKQSKDERVVDFCERQFWRGVKLFQNILSWSPLISPEVLGQAALTILFNQKLLPYLKTLPTEPTALALKVLAEAVPKDFIHFFPPNYVPPSISLLHQQVSQLISQLEQDPRNPLLVELVPLLVRLNDSDTSRQLKSRYNLG